MCGGGFGLRNWRRIDLEAIEVGGYVLAPCNFVVGPGESVGAGSAAELFVGRREKVEEVKLTLAGKGLVMPLDMLQTPRRIIGA